MSEPDSEPQRRPRRVVKAPRGPAITAKSWLTEAPLRMLTNNLDPDVAENPRELVVYGGMGRAGRPGIISTNSTARAWPCTAR